MPPAPGRYAGLPPGHPAIPPDMEATNTTPRVIEPADIAGGVVDELIDRVVDNGDTRDKAPTRARTLRSATRSVERQYPK